MPQPTEPKLKYNKEKTKLYSIRLCYSTDAEMIDYLDSLENKQGYIKELIRADMAGRKTKNEN